MKELKEVADTEGDFEEKKGSTTSLAAFNTVDDENQYAKQLKNKFLCSYVTPAVLLSVYSLSDPVSL